jgi:hypothetical protein
MTLTVGSKYILRFIISGRELVFTATLLEEDNILIKFKDKYDKVLSYNKSNLISAEEVNNGNGY